MPYMVTYSELHWSTAKFLLKFSVEHAIDEISEEMEVASMEAAIKADNLNFIEFFVVQYCKPKKKFLPKMKSRKYQNGYPLLHLACEMGEIQIVQYLVECVGFRVNQKDYNKMKPLDYAKKWDHQEIIDYLKQDSKSAKSNLLRRW